MSEEFKTQLQIVIGAGERTRGILYFFGLLFAAIFALTFDADVFPWTAYRQDWLTNAFICYALGKNDDETPPELYGKKLCKEYYNYIASNYGVLLPPPADYPKSWEPITDRYKAMTQAFVDTAYTTLPILSMKIERNNAFIFATLIDIMALVTLRLSLRNEINCVTNIIPLLTTKHDANAVLSCHVFSRPRSRESWFWWFLFIPAAAATYDLGTNFWQINLLQGILSISGWQKVVGIISTMGLFYFLNAVFVAATCLVSWLCFHTARSLDNVLLTVEALDLPAEASL